MKKIQVAVFLAGFWFLGIEAKAQTNGFPANGAAIHHSFDGAALLERLRMKDQQFVAFTNAEFTFTNGEVVKIEPSAILIEQGASGARCLLKDLPRSLQKKFGYDAAEAASYEALKKAADQQAQQRSAESLLQAQQAQKVRSARALAAQKRAQEQSAPKVQPEVYRVTGVSVWNAAIGKFTEGILQNGRLFVSAWDSSKDVAAANAKSRLPAGAQTLGTTLMGGPRGATPNCPWPGGYGCVIEYKLNSANTSKAVPSIAATKP